MLSVRHFSLVSSLLFSQTMCLGQEDSATTLLKIRERVAANISKLPNYLCTETLARENFQIESVHRSNSENSCTDLLNQVAKSPSSAKLVASDRLRLDVALNSKTEMYSWVGEGRFDDRSLSQIVNRGTTSTGAFGSFLHAIFVSDGAEFTFKEKSTEGGREILIYDFAVSLKNSGYYVSNNSLSRLTGYTGTFKVDANTLDLLQLEIRTDPLPPVLKVCKTTTHLDYARVQLSGLNVLLPSEVNVRMLVNDGSESHNKTIFSGCHQFLGESKLILDDKPTENAIVAPPAAKAKTIHLSEGLKVDIALTQMIDPATAAEGDPIRGKLVKATKDSQSGVTIPKGTVVNGRIFGLVLIHTAGVQLDLGLKWESFELDGLSHPLQLAVKWAASASSGLPVLHGQFRDIETAMRPEQPGIGFFLFPFVGPAYKIPSGFQAEWVTVAPDELPDKAAGQR